MFVVITGGSGSGKSAYAEKTVQSFGAYRRIYVATMDCHDQESVKRIKRHREMRSGKGVRDPGVSQKSGGGIHTGGIRGSP